MSGESFKTCSCGRTFSREGWLALPLLGVGFYVVGDAECGAPEAPIVEEEEEECHESRNCPCGSTLSRKIGTTREAGVVFRTMLVEHGEMFEALRAVQRRCTELVDERRLREKLERNATYGKGEAGERLGLRRVALAAAKLRRAIQEDRGHATAYSELSEALDEAGVS